MIARHAEAWRSGDLSFEQFARASHSEFAAIARSLYRRWPLPAGVGLADIEQELLLGAWWSQETYDEAKGRFGQWCVHVAYEHAKAFIHKQRGALRRRSTSPSRHAVLVDDPARFDVRTNWTPEHTAITISQLQHSASAAPHDRVLALLADGHDIVTIVERLYADPVYRCAQRWSNTDDAWRVVTRTVAAAIAAA